MNEDFINQAKKKRNEYLLKTEELFRTQKNRWLADFAKHFCTICTQIRKGQDESTISAITNLEYTMLYTNFINRCYYAEVFAYEGQDQLEKPQLLIASYNISFLFIFFNKLWDDLLALKRRYIGQIMVTLVDNNNQHEEGDIMGVSYVVDGARLSCSMGASPSNLGVLPTRKVKLRGSLRANIGDSKIAINIRPFGVCKATSPPKPCTPACVMWLGGKTDVLVENLPALLSNSKLLCLAGGGTIKIDDDGQ